MSEKPILFSGPMVRAILDGTKTQTRRVVKHQPLTDDVRGPMMYHPVTTNRRGEEVEGKPVFGIYDSSGEWGVRRPYGRPGDELWVRESGWKDPAPFTRGKERFNRFFYRDGYVKNEGESPVMGMHKDWDRSVLKVSGLKPCPSIHMPRWASRISLEIMGIRVERLQDISEADALAEGVEWLPGDWCSWGYAVRPNWSYVHDTPQDAYRALWESINGPGSWDANPWVWVVEFAVKGGAK